MSHENKREVDDQLMMQVHMTSRQNSLAKQTVSKAADFLPGITVHVHTRHARDLSQHESVASQQLKQCCSLYNQVINARHMHAHHDCSQ